MSETMEQKREKRNRVQRVTFYEQRYRDVLPTTSFINQKHCLKINTKTLQSKGHVFVCVPSENAYYPPQKSISSTLIDHLT